MAGREASEAIRQDFRVGLRADVPVDEDGGLAELEAEAADGELARVGDVGEAAREEVGTRFAG